MAKKFLKAIFASEEGEEPGGPVEAQASDGAANGDGDEARGRPRSLADSWERLTDQNRRLEQRLEALAAAQKELVEVAERLDETATKQLQVLNYLGKFHESSEKRGREMENAFRGVPDVLRTLPSATKEQAERLSEIAARLYEKAQDNTVNALKSAQANHQRAIEDLIDKSLGATRRLTVWAMLLVAAAAVLVVYVWLQS